MKPRLLDLFCGAGGAAKGYQRAGFYVVGVDIEPQPNYCGDEFIQLDAMEAATGLQVDLLNAVLPYDASDFAAAHASPPCQAYSAATGAEHRDSHPDLVAPVRERLVGSGLPYVIENVERSPLVNPITLCGSGFGLPLRRHRLFETSFPVMAVPCAHGGQVKRFDVYEHGKWRKSATPAIYGKGGRKAVEHWPEALGIDWMTRDEMAQAIPPAYTEHIGRFLLAFLEFTGSYPAKPAEGGALEKEAA